MDKERSSTIILDGDKYDLLLTTRATKDISARYGGLEALGDKLMASKNMESTLDEIVWLITTLANQGILVYNIKHKDAPKELLTEEIVELLTSPADFVEYKDAIMEAMYRGTKRNIKSEEDSKNVQAG